MASFHTKTFSNHDEYYTPKSSWEAIKEYIPNKIIWEAFSMSSSRSADFLIELGFDVRANQNDFFNCDPPDDTEIIVSNPPFSMVKQIAPELLKLDMPFILIMPCSKLITNYMREYRDKGIQIIIPRKRIQLTKIRME